MSTSVSNYGSGSVTNRGVGNIEGSTISDVGNNNSENHFQPGPMPTNATKKKKPAITPRQNMRQQTAPPQFQMSTSIHNHGSGTMSNSDVGNIKNSNISNVGNNNSKNYYQYRPKRYGDY